MTVAEAPALVARSGSAASAAPDAPARDGEPWRFEMVFSGGTLRAYADTAAALVDALVPGYLINGDDDRWLARLRLAAQAQVDAQAYLNAEHGLLDASAEQVRVLTGPRHAPPAVDAWHSDVPLVLVDAHYVPHGPLPVPAEGSNIEWIRVGDDFSLLVSLDQIGFLALHEHGEDSRAHADEEDG